MNDQNVVCTHELTVRYEQFEDGSIQYYVLPDQDVADTYPASLVTLAEHGAPLSLMGIRALWKLCADGLVVNSLDFASMVRNEVGLRLRPTLEEALEAELIETPEGATIN